MGRPVTVTVTVSSLSASDTAMGKAVMVAPCAYVLSPGLVIIGGAFESPGSVVAGGASVSVSVSVTVTVNVSVTSVLAPSLAVIVAVWSRTSASLATVPLTSPFA